MISRVGHLLVLLLSLRDRLSEILDRVCSVVPSSSMIGSSKRFDQPSFAIGVGASESKGPHCCDPSRQIFSE
jgi:hypothetical protein